MVTLSNNSFVADSGCAYVTLLPKIRTNPLLEVIGDPDGNPQASDTTLYESGKALGPSRAQHDVIRQHGSGAFSHWGNFLYFSSSDCSSPVTNGREYSVVLSVGPKVSTRFIGSLAALGVVTILWFSLSAPIKSQLRRLARAVIGGSITPSDKLSSSLAFLVFAALLISGSSIYLIYLWSSGRSVSLSVAGLYQISDASGYWVCSNSLLDSGTFGNAKSAISEWCQRRSIYPNWLAGIVAMGGRTIHGVLIVQAAIVSLALGLFIRQGMRLTGWVGGLLIGALLFPYLQSHAWALTMTENAGLAFGLAGVAYLLRAAEMRTARWMFIGCALMSIALNARAGAFFVLPILILWSVLAARLTQRRTILWGLYAVAGCTVGFLLQFIIVWAIGGDPTHSHGSFSYTLYGLSVGGLGWQQVLADHPELGRVGSDGEQVRLIYGWAVSNILSAPWLFVDGITKGLQKYLLLVAFQYDLSLEKYLLGFAFWHDMPLSLSQFATFFWYSVWIPLWYLGWIPLWQRRHSPPYLLVGLGSLGVLLSAPLLAADDGARVLAATIAFDAIQMSIGLVWVVSLMVNRLFPPPAQTRRSLAPQSAWPDGIFVAILALCVLAPFAYRVLMPNKAVADITACKPGEGTLVTRIGYESLLLDLTESGQMPDFMKGEVDRAAFVGGLPIRVWWVPGVYTFKGKSILLGQQLNRSDIVAPGPYTVFSDEHLAPYIGKTVRVCVSSYDTQELFGAQYRKIESIKIVD